MLQDHRYEANVYCVVCLFVPQLLLIPNYTAWWEKHKFAQEGCEQLAHSHYAVTLAEVRTSNLLIVSPMPQHYATMLSSCINSKLLLLLLKCVQRGLSSLRERRWIWICSAVVRLSMSREHSCWSDSASLFTAVKSTSTSGTCPTFKVLLSCLVYLAMQFSCTSCLFCYPVNSISAPKETEQSCKAGKITPSLLSLSATKLLFAGCSGKAKLNRV